MSESEPEVGGGGGDNAAEGLPELFINNYELGNPLAHAVGFSNISQMNRNQVRGAIEQMMSVVGVDNIYALDFPVLQTKLAEMLQLIGALPQGIDVSKIAAGDLGPVKAAVDKDDFVVRVPCPMCGKDIPEDKMEKHIDTCLELKAQERAIEDAEAGPKWKCAFCMWMSSAKSNKCERCSGRRRKISVLDHLN
jgi:hypothetical protein